MKKIVYFIFALATILLVVNTFSTFTITSNTISEQLEIKFDEDTIKGINLPEIFQLDASGYTYTQIDNINIEINQVGIALITPDKEFNGIKKVIFKALNENGAVIDSKEVLLNIQEINDLPIVKDKLNDIIIKLGEEKKFVFNLNTIFEDVDNTLTYNVKGNNKIKIKIDKFGSISLASNEICKEYVIFSASDGENTVYSNNISITVKDNIDFKVLPDNVPTGNVPVNNIKDYQRLRSSRSNTQTKPKQEVKEIEEIKQEKPEVQIKKIKEPIEEEPALDLDQPTSYSILWISLILIVAITVAIQIYIKYGGEIGILLKESRLEQIDPPVFDSQKAELINKFEKEGLSPPKFSEIIEVEKGHIKKCEEKRLDNLELNLSKLIDENSNQNPITKRIEKVTKVIENTNDKKDSLKEIKKRLEEIRNKNKEL